MPVLPVIVGRSTPYDSIWALLGDMRAFVCRNPGVEVLAADHPGESIGWLVLEGDREWRIGVGAFKWTRNTEALGFEPGSAEGLREMLMVAEGRRRIPSYLRGLGSRERLNRYALLMAD